MCSLANALNLAFRAESPIPTPWNRILWASRVTDSGEQRRWFFRAAHYMEAKIKTSVQSQLPEEILLSARIMHHGTQTNPLVCYSTYTSNWQTSLIGAFSILQSGTHPARTLEHQTTLFRYRNICAAPKQCSILHIYFQSHTSKQLRRGWPN